MALTITEQLQLINGSVKPPSNQMKVLVHQAAAVYALHFYDTHKAIDGATSPAAMSYVNKMYSVSNSALHSNGDVVDRLMRIMVVIISKTDFTLLQISNANDAEWEGFIYDKIDEAMEYYAGIKKEEKQAYIAAQG